MRSRKILQPVLVIVCSAAMVVPAAGAVVALADLGRTADGAVTLSPPDPPPPCHPNCPRPKPAPRATGAPPTYPRNCNPHLQPCVTPVHAAAVPWTLR